MTQHIKSFDLVGKVEDVSDVISLIKPTDTPFLSAIGTDSTDQTYFSWMEDDLRDARKNTNLEGADAVDSVRDQPQMRFNGTQILEETFKLSGTAQAIKLYGRKGAVSRETYKTGKLLKMDLEHSLVGTAQTYVAATPTVEGEFAGVQAQISTATTDANGGTPRALDETSVVDVLEALYDAGGEASALMVKPTDTRKIAAWSQASGRTVEVKNGDKKLTNVVNVYETPFGTVKVQMNRRLKATDALAFTPSNWKLVKLRDWRRTKLAKTGDSDRWQMLGEFSLKHMNQKASALITDLS